MTFAVSHVRAAQIPRQLSETMIAFATGSGDLVDRIDKIVPLKGKYLFKVFVAVIRGDTTGLRFILDSQGFQNDCQKYLKIDPELLAGVLAIAYGNEIHPWDVEKSVNASNKLRKLIRPCVTLARLAEDMAFHYSDFSIAVLRPQVAELCNVQVSSQPHRILRVPVTSC